MQSIDIETTPGRLYEAITTQQGLAGWWTPQVKAEPTVGALNEFRFEGTTLTFRVEELEPARHVAWSSVQVPPTGRERRSCSTSPPETAPST